METNQVAPEEASEYDSQEVTEYYDEEEEAQIDA